MNRPRIARWTKGARRLFCIGLALWASVLILAFAQTTPNRITIVVQDGRNGRPIKGTHLLVFGGGSPEEARGHLQHFDLMTDQSGTAILDLPSDGLKYLQVWVDGETLCQANPNSIVLKVGAILSQGLSAPNSCGQLSQLNEPGRVLIFARPSTFIEKMRH